MPIEKRLYGNIRVNDKTGCWEWLGSLNGGGYGRILIGSRKDGTRRNISTHRLSYELSCGKIPKGMEVCHKCDNRICINPDHLFIGTHQDNIDDRERKGRNVVYHGENKSNSKLTEQMVIEARLERENKKTSYQKLADKYGVCKKTIMCAIKGTSWKCVDFIPPPPKMKGAE
jgi:hypothetical protein